MIRGLLWLALVVAVASSEFVTKKFCKDVDQSLCSVFSVMMDPCIEGPNFCGIKRDKKYLITPNLAPHFSAERVRLAVYADAQSDVSFGKVLKGPVDACGTYLTCPVVAEERRIFDVDLNADKRFSGKFPIMVKLWNENNATQACCFTITVKVKGGVKNNIYKH